ncbi:MAG: ParB/RepB/Spo0J family partition protein [Lachnospiraceae bacterium]|jgi:ParB family chromosome partitioning protein|nr:ParB/RepB/Spo0J family partition protein [Lachnospiraceae bacterium]
MARKHGGLGRGLDALIPQSAPKTEEVTVEIRDHEAAAEQTREEKTEENVSRETFAEERDNLQRDRSERRRRETTLRVSQIEPNRSQPRKTFDEDALEELADSIRQYGLIQPIMVQKRDGYYEIIAGERRWRACMKAGLKEVPVIIREYDDQKIMELSLIENLQREDLNPMEEARAYKRLMEEFGLTQEEIAGRVSKSRPVIANALRLLKLDERVQAMVEQGEISMGHARALASVLIPEEQYLIALKIMEEHLTVRDTEKIIKNIGKVPKKKEPVQKDESLERIYRELENRLKSSLGTKVAIHTRGTGGGKVEIDFYTAEDLEKIIDRITSE